MCLRQRPPRLLWPALADAVTGRDGIGVREPSRDQRESVGARDTPVTAGAGRAHADGIGFGKKPSAFLDIYAEPEVCGDTPIDEREHPTCVACGAARAVTRSRSDPRAYSIMKALNHKLPQVSPVCVTTWLQRKVKGTTTRRGREG